MTVFCERLSGEVRMQTGEEFHIFQDRKNIAWGEQWQQRIENSIDAVTFLIPVVTPGFFKSSACRDELTRFLGREKELGRNDLILPVYYVDCPSFNNEAKREADPLAKIIAGRQYADWRALRFEPFTSPDVGKTLAKMARQIAEALERGQVPPPADAASPASQTSLENAPIDIQRHDETPTRTVEPKRSPSPNSEPPTRVVDALHRGDHPTLTEALKVAKPGDRILVRPGLYQEGVVIDKPVEIVGDGEVGEVVIQATGTDTVLFRANMGRIANLTLRQAGGGDWCCVHVAQGRLELEGCDITSQCLACVAIRGQADPRLRRNRIHDGKQGGVLVYENDQGTLEDNEIFANAFAGVLIIKGGNPTLRRNRIHDGKECGVQVGENGEGTFEDNDIFANARAGVVIKEVGNPTLRRNQIHDGKQGGVVVSDNGQGTLEDNDIFANAFSGVLITSGGNPTLRRNRIHDGKKCGVQVGENGEGTFEDNDIFANAFSGVFIAKGGNPILRRNRINDGKHCGVFVHESGQGTLEHNDIFANALAGMVIKEGGNPTLCRNQIHDGKQCGVLVSENGQGTLEDNDIFANAFAGVEIKKGGNPILLRNHILNNGGQAVRVYDRGQGVIQDNDLRGNKQGALSIAPNCMDKVKRARNRR